MSENGKSDRHRQLAWAMFVFSSAGLVICVALYIFGTLSEKVMLGLTLALSWIALQYPAVLAIWFANDESS